MKLDEAKLALARVRAMDARWQANELQTQARALIAKAENIERSWGLEPQDPAPGVRD